MCWTGELARPTLRASTPPIKASGQNTTESLTKVNCLKELDQIWPAEMHLTFTSPAAMFGIALVIFLIGMLIWKKCFNLTWKQSFLILVDSEIFGRRSLYQFDRLFRRDFNASKTYTLLDISKQ
jgi:hypothetical protein